MKNEVLKKKNSISNGIFCFLACYDFGHGSFVG